MKLELEADESIIAIKAATFKSRLVSLEFLLARDLYAPRVFITSNLEKVSEDYSESTEEIETLEPIFINYCAKVKQDFLSVFK